MNYVERKIVRDGENIYKVMSEKSSIAEEMTIQGIVKGIVEKKVEFKSYVFLLEEIEEKGIPKIFGNIKMAEFLGVIREVTKSNVKIRIKEVDMRSIMQNSYYDNSGIEDCLFSMDGFEKIYYPNWKDILVSSKAVMTALKGSGIRKVDCIIGNKTEKLTLGEHLRVKKNIMEVNIEVNSEMEISSGRTVGAFRYGVKVTVGEGGERARIRGLEVEELRIKDINSMQLDDGNISIDKVRVDRLELGIRKISNDTLNDIKAREIVFSQDVEEIEVKTNMSIEVRNREVDLRHTKIRKIGKHFIQSIAFRDRNIYRLTRGVGIIKVGDIEVEANTKSTNNSIIIAGKESIIEVDNREEKIVVVREVGSTGGVRDGAIVKEVDTDRYREISDNIESAKVLKIKALSEKYREVMEGKEVMDKVCLVEMRARVDGKKVVRIENPEDVLYTQSGADVSIQNDTLNIRSSFKKLYKYIEGEGESEADKYENIKVIIDNELSNSVENRSMEDLIEVGDRFTTGSSLTNTLGLTLNIRGKVSGFDLSHVYGDISWIAEGKNSYGICKSTGRLLIAEMDVEVLEGGRLHYRKSGIITKIIK